MATAQHSSRREFLRQTLSKTAATGIAPYFLAKTSWAADAVGPPSDRVRLAAIGTGIRGTDIGKTLFQYGQIMAICDVDSDHRARYHDMLVKNGVSTAQSYQDYREVLDRDDIDAVVIATPITGT